MNKQAGQEYYCNFCFEAENSGSNDSLIFHSNQLFFAVPTEGCFVQGYSLVVTRQHMQSFASLNSREILEAELFLEVVRSRIESVFGPCILSEHGTGEDELSVACVDHAHIHVIPISHHGAKIFDHYVQEGGEPITLTRLSDVSKFASKSYVLVSLSPEDFFLWPSSSHFPRQFARISAAHALDMMPYYDWRAHRFAENMVTTYSLLTNDERP